MEAGWTKLIEGSEKGETKTGKEKVKIASKSIRQAS